MVEKQIAIFQTGKKLLEFKDNLNPATAENYANVHCCGGKKGIPSRIGLLALDYSTGTGADKTKSAAANLSVSEVRRLHAMATACITAGGLGGTRCEAGEAVLRTVKNKHAEVMKLLTKIYKEAEQGSKTISLEQLAKVGAALRDIDFKIPNVQDVNFTSDKIIAAKKDKNGRAPVTRLNISRTVADPKTGELRRYPWYVRITNGTAEPNQTTTGGTAYKGNTFTMISEVFVNLTDEDMYRCLSDVVNFIGLWEMTNVISVIEQGQAQYASEAIERAQERNTQSGKGASQ